MEISILGCGWLGFPLALSLIEDSHTVKGSTTTREKVPELENHQIDPYLLELNPELECEKCDSFWDADVLVLNIPPGRGKEDVVEYHTRQVQSVITQLKSSPIAKVIFISSTSVYPEKPGVVEEDDTIPGKASRESGIALLEAEKMLIESKHFETTVIRFGGLYGSDRNPVKYLAGKKNLEKGNAPVNLIHRDDCIEIIKLFINKPIDNGIFNAVSDGHPPRKVYYRETAKRMGLKPPTFKDEDENNYKIVSNRKLKNAFNYKFKYPNPLSP